MLSSLRRAASFQHTYAACESVTTLLTASATAQQACSGGEDQAASLFARPLHDQSTSLKGRLRTAAATKCSPAAACPPWRARPPPRVGSNPYDERASISAFWARAIGRPLLVRAQQACPLVATPPPCRPRVRACGLQGLGQQPQGAHCQAAPDHPQEGGPPIGTGGRVVQSAIGTAPRLTMARASPETLSHRSAAPPRGPAWRCTGRTSTSTHRCGGGAAVAVAAAGGGRAAHWQRAGWRAAGACTPNVFVAAATMGLRARFGCWARRTVPAAAAGDRSPGSWCVAAQRRR